jgi:hypothetical protein
MNQTLDQLRKDTPKEVAEHAIYVVDRRTHFCGEVFDNTKPEFIAKLRRAAARLVDEPTRRHW